MILFAFEMRFAIKFITAFFIANFSLITCLQRIRKSILPTGRIHNLPIFASARPSTFHSQDDYLAYLSSIATLPAGFKVGNHRFNFSPYEVANKVLPMNITVIVTDKPTTAFAAMFTSNQFPGGPIIVGKERVKNSNVLSAVIINNKISNVCPGGGVSDRGVGDSDEVCTALAEALGLSSKAEVIPSSTGIIGWRLPVPSIKGALPSAVQNLQSKTFLPAALGITTTDRYPKLRSFVSSDRKWSVSGVAKGAGMIEPNMATMLCYILTDLDVPRSFLDAALKSAVAESFNRISVDGDQSTSDTVLLLSSQCVPSSASAEAEFLVALKDICKGLSEDIVRNGEGTQHVVKVDVRGAPSDIFARDLGRFIVNSNLVKCAIAGCDPNVGRIVGAIGSFLGTKEAGNLIAKNLVVTLGGITIFSDDAFQLNPAKEKLLSNYLFDSQLFPATLEEHSRNYPMHSKTVDIEVQLEAGDGHAEVIGSDLTKEYVEVNADYRS